MSVQPPYKVRVRGPQGQVVLEHPVSPLSTLSHVVSVLAERWSLALTALPGIWLSWDPAGKQPLIPSLHHQLHLMMTRMAEEAYNTTTLESLGIRHGALIFATILPSTTTDTTTTPDSSPENVGNGTIKPTTNIPPQRDIPMSPMDVALSKDPGTVSRQRDPMFCQHGDKGMCDYCSPREPYDADLLKERSIKFMSFWAHVKKIKVNKPKLISTKAFLEHPQLAVLCPCPTRAHADFPAGICSRCQPPPITLALQPFRMIDHVEFEQAPLVERFIAGWRSSGVQRFGFLYGTYAPYPNVPLGIKANVSFIWEPKHQQGEVDGVTLGDLAEEEAHMQKIMTFFGLQKIGMIYTDLVDDGSQTGKVICKRHVDSYFVSSAEILSMAKFQLANPYLTELAESGAYGSRFVTVVISGNAEGQIDLSCYAVSNTAMALVQEDLLEASIVPEVMRVCPSTPQKYVPEVFYKYKNEFGLEVRGNASPAFPVDYLLVSMTHGFPSNPLPPTFQVATPPFPANASGTYKKDHSYLQDANFLAFLSSLGIDVCGLLNTAGVEGLWAVVQEMDASLFGVSAAWSASGPSTVQTSNTDAMIVEWHCPHCTFVNATASADCSMCGLPRS